MLRQQRERSFQQKQLLQLAAALLAVAAIARPPVAAAAATAQPAAASAASDSTPAVAGRPDVVSGLPKLIPLKELLGAQSHTQPLVSVFVCSR